MLLSVSWLLFLLIEHQSAKMAARAAAVTIAVAVEVKSLLYLRSCGLRAVELMVVRYVFSAPELHATAG